MPDAEDMPKTKKRKGKDVEKVDAGEAAPEAKQCKGKKDNKLQEPEPSGAAEASAASSVKSQKKKKKETPEDDHAASEKPKKSARKKSLMEEVEEEEEQKIKRDLQRVREALREKMDIPEYTFCEVNIYWTRDAIGVKAKPASDGNTKQA